MSRCIDADALKESIRCSDTDEPKVLSPKKLHKVLTEWIDKRPTIEERKMGRWIEDAKTYYEQLNERGLRVDEYTPYFTDDIACSVCLAKYSMIDNETQFFKFCPNCGADMRGEPDE